MIQRTTQQKLDTMIEEHTSLSLRYASLHTSHAQMQERVKKPLEAVAVICRSTHLKATERLARIANLLTEAGL